MTEKLCREQLLMSWDGIKKGDAGIMRILMERIPKVHSAFVLTWTPEQYEDIFTILVNGVCVVSFEVSKINSTVTDYECADVGDLPPVFRANLILVESVSQEDGHEEAIHRRADHRLPE
ncbi:hypothetical protein, partial [Achromobacter deleyi]|uniref:hypothetical protein n=1 Tax=Achromobacter deleyi TaxID=1353891 RepID=UPI001C2EF709